MKITVNTTYEVSYQVCFHRQTEGGMDYREFGESCKTLEQAISNLELARLSEKGEDWIIVCDVQKQVSKGVQP
jgi:hypothetical protein